jgi:hypothetical protein
MSSVSGDSSLFVSSNFGFFSSTDLGVSWFDASQGSPASTASGLVRTSSGRLVIGAPRGIYYREESETTWTQTYPVGHYLAASVSADGLGNLYTLDPSGRTDGYGYVYRSTNAGLNWLIDTASVKTLPNQGVAIGKFYLDELGNEYTSERPFTDNSWHLFRKPIGGVWTDDSTGMHLDPQSYASILAFTTDGGSYIYCSTIFDNRIFRRPLGGSVWTVDTAGIGLKQLSSLFQGAGGDIYGSDFQTGGFYRRHNDVWSNMPRPSSVPISSTVSVSALSIDGGGALYAAFLNRAPGGLNQVFYTTDQGANWTNVGIDSLTINQLVSYGDTTYALTNSRGLIRMIRAAAPTYKCGDADGSSSINVSDVVFLINYIFASGPAPNPFAAGDPDCSGTVNISDGVYLINYIFASGPLPCAACK